MTETLRFDPDDFDAPQIAPGLHLATIESARYQRSRTGSDMIQVVYVLDGGARHPVRVTDYFVVGGGSAGARRRSPASPRALPGVRPRSQAW